MVPGTLHSVRFEGDGGGGGVEAAYLFLFAFARGCRRAKQAAPVYPREQRSSAQLQVLNYTLVTQKASELYGEPRTSLEQAPVYARSRARP